MSRGRSSLTLFVGRAGSGGHNGPDRPIRPQLFHQPIVENNMKTILTILSRSAFIVLLLSGAATLGSDGGIKVLTTAKTNAVSGTVLTRDVFTRAGQTNLVRSARSKGSVVDSATHRFYHSGDLVGEFATMPGCSYFTTKAGSPYSVSFMFGPSNETQSAWIRTKDNVIVDVFNYTNGMFSPAENSSIAKANSAQREILEAMGKDK